MSAPDGAGNTNAEVGAPSDAGDERKEPVVKKQEEEATSKEVDTLVDANDEEQSPLPGKVRRVEFDMHGERTDTLPVPSNVCEEYNMPDQDEPTETTPLLAASDSAFSRRGTIGGGGSAPKDRMLPGMGETVDRLNKAYSLKESHGQFENSGGYDTGGYVSNPVCIDYEPLKLSTFRVFGVITGTVLQDTVIYMEQIFLTLLFIAAAAPVYYFFDASFLKDRHAQDMTIREWVGKQEEKMRAFSVIMTGLAAFLLSFYTSIAVGRWWTIRTAGVGGVKAAACELELLVYQLVTQEEMVISAIRRYARASLILVFLWRRGVLEETEGDIIMEDLFYGRGLLTEHECNQLLKWNHNLHESIWAWQAGIVTALYREGKIKSDQLLNTLLNRCSEGRCAMQLIHTYIGVKIPMQYVHLLGLLVKLHNTVLAFIMGVLFGAAIKNGRVIICMQLFGRTLILPFLFNAILLINAELSDPFDGGMSDFPGNKYEKALENDVLAFKSASDNLPPWMDKRTKAAWKQADAKTPSAKSVEKMHDDEFKSPHIPDIA